MIMADEQKPDRQDQHQQEENDDEQQQKEHNKEETPQSPPSKVARVSSDESAAAGVVTTAAASPLVLGRGPGVGTAATAAGEEGKPPGFTFMQMQEFHHQALIFKHMVAGIPVPILPIWKSVAASYGPHHYPSFVGLGNLCYDFRNSIEPEPGRCRRRDGKQWRCSRDVVPDQKYCERHMQRGRNHSRKPVEAAAAAATTTSVGMDESSHDAQSPHHRPPGFRASPSTGGFATPSTQASQPYGYEAINQMMMEMNMSPAGSSSQYYGGGYHQVMDPFYAGMVRGSLPPPGYSFPAVGSPRTIGPYTRFIQPDILPPFGGSYPFSGTPLPSHSDKHTSEDTCSSKKSRGRDDSDVSSSVKKSKMSIGGKISKALNKLWEEKHDDFVIPYLADLSRQGYKVDKTFKASAFSMAAHAVNKKFGTDFGGPNVSNHYRSLRTRFQDICSCFNISGAEWDEESRTITLDPISYDRWEKKNTKLKAFVNKPLTHFDDLRLIIGDDFATEELKKSVFDKFGKIPFSAIHVTIDPLADIRQDAASAEEIVDQPIGGSGGSSGPIRIPDALGGGSKSTKPRKKKQVVDEDVMRTMVDKVGDLSNAIRQTIPTHWTVQLSQCVYGHLDYDDVVLDTAYARLFESEMVARFFIAKPLNAQKRYLDELARELKWDVPTSRARVEIVSSSDEDDGGGNDNEVDLSS